jgi:hypothetical protein
MTKKKKRRKRKKRKKACCEEEKKKNNKLEEEKKKIVEEKDKEIDRLEKEQDLVRREKIAETERANAADKRSNISDERANLLASELASAKKLAADKLAENGLLDGKVGTAAAFVAGGLATNALNEAFPKPLSQIKNYIFTSDKKEEEKKVVEKPAEPALELKKEPEAE